MKKKYFLAFMSAVAVFLGILSFVYLHNSKNVSYKDPQLQEIKKGIDGKVQEMVNCGTTNPPRCFQYRCDTGFIYTVLLPAPGIVPFRCTDGSTIRETGAVVPHI